MTQQQRNVVHHDEEFGKTVRHSGEYPCSKEEGVTSITTTRTTTTATTTTDQNHHHAGNHNLGHPNATKKIVSCDTRRAAIKLNHEGVKLLKSGTTEEGKALEIFKCALRLVKTDLSSGGGEIPSSWSPAPHPCIHECCSGGLLPHDKPLLVVPVPVSTTSPIRDDNSLFFYSKVFTFQLSKADYYSSCRLASPEILSAGIIYNIALALNLKGIRTNCSAMMKKALDLYKMSMGLVLHDECFQTSLVSRSVAIACCNNVGQLAYNFFCDYEQAQTMRGTLQMLLATSLFCSSQRMLVAAPAEQELAAGASPPLGGGPSSSSRGRSSFLSLLLFDEADMQGFKANLLFLYPPSTSPAA